MATGNYIPEKFYVGRSSRGQDSVLGFMTPVTKDASYAGRQKTVNKWSDNDLPKLEVENKAQLGFRVVDNVSRYSTSNVVWRVLHPRGFEIEISSGNFMHLIQECQIDEGEFNNPLLFVRCGSDNFLTFEGSDVHSSAHAVGDIDNKVPMKDVQLGDTILLKDGTEGIYYGSAHFVTASRYRNHEFGKSVRRHVYQSTRADGTVLYISRSSLHVTKVIHKVQSAITKQDAFDHLYDVFKNPKKNVSISIYDYCDIVGIFQKPAKQSDLEYNPRIITKAEYKAHSSLTTWRYMFTVGSLRYRKETVYQYNRGTQPHPNATATSIECVQILGDGIATPWSVDNATVTTGSGYHTYSRTETVAHYIEPTNITSYEVLEVVRK